MLSIALALAACSAQPTPLSTPTSTPEASLTHPTDANVVILRLEDGGGIMPMELFATHAPTFSLYGDGTAVYQPIDSRAGNPVGGLQPLQWRKATLDEAQIGALLGYALGQGGLGEARDHYDDPSIIDAPGSVFTIRANGLDKTVNVYALGMEGQNTPDREIRARFLALAGLLRDFWAQVAAGRATDAGIYEAAAYRAVLLEAQGVPGEVRDWPWADLAPADFTAPPNSEQSEAIVSPDQARELSATPEGGFFAIAVVGPDGVLYTVALRPLLPDETE